MQAHRILVTLFCLGLCLNATATEVVFQALDTVKVNSQMSVLDMAFDDPRRSADFIDSDISGDNFTACQLTAIDGLYCLDGKIVSHWPNTEEPTVFSPIINCEDPALNLDQKKADTCTSMTVDLSGAVWLAGKNKGKTHSLIKVLPKNGSCPPGYSLLESDAYCANEVATGRPLLVDITPVDGDFATEFPLGSGILGLEQRKTAVFFNAVGTPTEIASGKQDWGLAGNEQLTGVTAIQIVNALELTDSYVLATTTSGRVLAKKVGTSGSANFVFDIASSREAGSVQCDFSSANYAIRASSKSGLIYITDRQYCEVIALSVSTDVSGDLVELVNATEPTFHPMTGEQNGTRNLTLSTTSGSAAIFPPEGTTIAPGIGIDLDDCVGFCPLVVDLNGDVAASLSNVSLASAESGLTLFQVKNIPDCRYDPVTCQELLGITDLLGEGVILDPDSTGLPQAQLLNLTKLLPKEITDLFVAEGGLPDMYVARQYRGQKNNNFTFEAFFGVTEDGVIFRDTFDSEFHVQALAGTELGCRLGLPDLSPLYTENSGQPDEEFGTLNWDIINTVSEQYVSLVDPSAPDHVSTLINAGCGSSKGSDTRWSLKPYNLEIAACSYNGDAGDVWASDGACPVGGPELPDDAVLAKLLLVLFDEFENVLNHLACADADGAGSVPLSGSACSTLNANWLNAKDKLDKCWNATQQPKESSGNQNCQAFISQLNGLESAVEGTTLSGLDPANRRGELKARLRVVRHLYDERVVPSIPAAGYSEL